MKNNKESKFDPRCHIGEAYGIYTIIDVLDKKDKYGHYIYIAECKECGYRRCSHYGKISGELSRVNKCKHLARGKQYIQRTKWNNKRIAHIFSDMKNRCYNPNDKAYKWYGAKGIKICDEWIYNQKSFEEWALQNGYNDTLTIDRVDENKDYSPNNCRWITNIQNSKYKSTTTLINVENEIHTGREWSKILGLGANRINAYIRKYGLENTIEFIKRYKVNPSVKRKSNQNLYELYMSQPFNL